jgi:hypothetical protein
MAVTSNSSGVEVADCEAAAKPNQMFHWPTPPGQGRGLIQTEVKDSAGNVLCFALV